MPFDLAVITCTGDRPDAFALAERYFARQDFSGSVQWIVIDDGLAPTACTRNQHVLRRNRTPHDPPVTLAVNLRHAMRAIESSRIVFWEDDDWYAPTYLSWCYAMLKKADLIGEANALYYHVGEQAYQSMANREHASLASTACNANVLDCLRVIVSGSDSPFVDLELWNRWGGSKVLACPESNERRRVVSVKGMPGRKGAGCGHNPQLPGYRHDPYGRLLGWLIGNDAGHYRPYRNQP